MLHDQVIRSPSVQDLLDIVQPFMSKVGIYGVHNRNFIIQDYIGIVRHSVWNLILSLKQIYLMIVYTYIFYTCTDFHMLPHFPVCS